MQFLTKSIGIMAVLAVLPGASHAVTARPSVLGGASLRMPTMTAKINTSVSGSTSTSGSTSSSLLANSECIEAYTDCLKGGEACGSNFEECTNNTLFYAKKPVCASVLMQCTASGINDLFGTSNQTAFSTKNANGEYIYPTTGSVLGQLIEAAHIANRYDTSTCVRRYTSCLSKDDVCGQDFELCTSNTEFKKQKLFCESTLARCQPDGIKELFGTTSTAANPTADSRLGILIAEGGNLAAVNAVATCYKVVDQCIQNACMSNPYKCKEGATQQLIQRVENVNATDGTVVTTDVSYEAVNRKDISGFIKKSCQATIGANKFCYATFLSDGVMPTSSQLKDQDNQDEIYDLAYSARMNDAMRAKIDDMIAAFDKKVKARCSDTIVSCAMRACGQGSGPACYASAFNKANKVQGVTNPATLADIKAGCEAVVNNDTACQYAGATFDATTGAFLFEEQSLFDKLFTAADDTDAKKPDAVGAVAALNSRLSTSYNQAALDNMKRQCQAVAQGCVKSLCGADYVNCYRNRTDVYSSLTNSGNEKFDKSMNKVGGVLDHTIVLGLCMNTVKNTSVCEEHIKAEVARNTAGASTADSWGTSWGVTDTRSGWLDAGTFNATENQVQDVDADGNLLCQTQQNGGDYGRCDDNSGQYIYPKMVSEGTYKLSQAERTIFRDLIYDLEIEAQAKYNAKLTKRQNMCFAANEGGIIGSKDLGSTYMWVKLKSNKVPKSYTTAGLSDKDIVASNDLYGSFCRIRVTLQSDDKTIQDAITAGKNWSSTYFAAGDAFTCGSWIPNSELEALSNQIGASARADAKAGQANIKPWMTALGTIGGGIGGGYLFNSMQDGAFLGGLMGKTTTKKDDKNGKSDAENCVEYATQVETLAQGTITDNVKAQIEGYATQAKKYADSANVPGAISIQVCVDKIDDKGKVETVCENKAKIKEDATALKNACNLAKDSGTAEDDDKKAARTRSWVNVAGAAVGSIAGGLIVNKMVDNIQDSKLDSAERAAKQEWMNNVGRHIRCFIGGEEVGMYGDILSTTLE